ncbi:MAG: hypothetical protein RDU14_02525 [Melioribacteraceae bacterium]|nr:hypothetical protein [Melioribacteraceae bacterium]
MAFIDILGFKSMLQTKPLNEIVELLDAIVRADNCAGYEEIVKINTRLISDSFIIWAQLSDPKHVSAYFAYLGTIIARIHKIRNIITRGYISNGNHFNSEKFWISQVFVEAFNGESKYSIHPRVILGPSAVDRINIISPDFIDSGLLKRDDDGFRFVNYMMCIDDAYQPKGNAIMVNLGGMGLEGSLLAHKENIEHGLSHYKSYVHKYYWLATYHNNFIKDFVNLSNKNDFLINLKSA